MAEETVKLADGTVVVRPPRWDKIRRRQMCYDAYYGTGEFAGKPGMSMRQIAEMMGISIGTVQNDIRYMERHAGKAALVRDEAVIEKVTQNTLDVLDDLAQLDEIIWEELEHARATNNRKGTFIPALMANLNKNMELRAKVLRLLDPKVEVTIKAEKAARLQEAILQALAELAPEMVDKIIARAEEIAAEMPEIQAPPIDVTPIAIETLREDGEDGGNS